MSEKRRAANREATNKNRCLHGISPSWSSALNPRKELAVWQLHLPFNLSKHTQRLPANNTRHLSATSITTDFNKMRTPLVYRLT